MGLIKCIDCGKEFSDRVEACPNCACPTKEILKELSHKKKENVEVSKTLLEFAEKKNNVKVARFINVKTGKTIQMTGYSLRMLIKSKKCIGKLCSDNSTKTASFKEFEIYNWANLYGF